MNNFSATRRKEMIEILEKNEMTARNLAEIFRVNMEYILEDLKHISLSIRKFHKKLEIRPAICNTCGFVFKDRKMLSRPTKCPKCRKEDITEPIFYIE
ncbi:MAG: transcriptional regulator [Candidatus Woesearchaeota archaeon]